MKLPDLSGLTREILEKRRLACLAISEKAVREHPREFHEIKRLLNYVLSNPIDIDRYFCTACTLAKLLDHMGKGTLFYHYYYENIHPNQFGRARYFRFMCRDLLEQINDLNQWRASRCKLVLIK
ncbi:MAG: hypothetical protein B6245_22650 [Desulfobacteraceae bacterium 4572_88]|nr:MAG: hypothetical protein B6245_22650 [Desulfobacteraceae bacterium 4572_88]